MHNCTLVLRKVNTLQRHLCQLLFATLFLFSASLLLSNMALAQVTTSCETFLDEFSTTSFSGQDGTVTWSADWDEYEGTDPTIPEATPDPANGHVQVTNGSLILNNFSPETQNFPGVERELDLSLYTSATFTFDFVTSGGVDLVDSMVIMASADGGGNFIELENITDINDTSGSKSYDLTPYISSNTKIRIRINNEAVSGLGAGCCYGGEPETFSVDNVQIEACSDSGGGSDTAATAFNCVENSADGISGKLYTKTTAQSFSFDIVALQDASTIETNFASGSDHTVTVELVDANSGKSCSDYSALDPAVSQKLTFTAADSGVKASVDMTSSTAYSNARCRVTDATDSPSIVGCSTDSFSIRPISFSNIIVEKINSDLSRTALPYTDADSTPIAKAGGDLAVTVTATTGYNETPSISSVEAHAGAINTGVISGLFSSANSVTGVATGSTFTYSEVGAFRFAAQAIFDAGFTAVDQSDDCTDDFSNSVVSGKVGCKFGNTSATAYFGRFTPDHFDVTLNTPEFTPGCGTFTYIGQAVKYATLPIATVTAKNVLGTTTQNYTGDFWKIDPAIGTDFTPLYSVATHSVMTIDSSKPTVSDSGNGSGTLTFSDTSSNILAVAKSGLVSPFDAEISLSFTLSDTDGVVLANVDGSPQANPVSFGATSSGDGISFSSKIHRWGRLALNNVHGSELTPLNMPTYTEYYNGSSFVINTADNCTDFTLPNANCIDATSGNNFSISDAIDFDCAFTTQTTPVTVGASGSVKACMSNTTVSNGETPLTLSDNTNTANGSGAGNTGYIDITTNLTNLSWLRYDWDADGTHDNCPSARATFGIYKGNSQQIYFREVY